MFTSDNFYLIRIKTEVGFNCVGSVTEPYLYHVKNEVKFKLLYCDRPQFSEDSISTKILGGNYYKIAYRRCGKEIIPLKDAEIQLVGSGLGFLNGSEIDNALCVVSDNFVLDVLFPEPTTSENHNICEVIDDIAYYYNLNRHDIGVTGSRLLRSLAPGDIDVVIPVDDYVKVRALITHQHMRRPSVQEYGLNWPLRWKSYGGHIVCPFFVYKNLTDIPVRRVEALGEWFSGPLQIISDHHGYFNMPVYECSDCILIIRSTLVRGMLQLNDRVFVKAPMYKIIDGSFKGKLACLVTNPWTEISDFEESVLRRWRLRDTLH